MLVHARQSIELAMEAHAVVCADHRDRQNGPVSVSVKCAVTTMYVSYARPFGPNHGLVRLNYENEIPGHLLETHKLLLGYRDKAIAHKDKTSHAISDSVNHVEIHVSNGNTCLAPIIHAPSHKEMAQFPELANSVLTLINCDMKVC